MNQVYRGHTRRRGALRRAAFRSEEEQRDSNTIKRNFVCAPKPPRFSSVFPVSPFVFSTYSFSKPYTFKVVPRMSKRDSPARLMAKDLIAGCFGGIGIVAVGHPFDTIKVNILS